MHVYHLILRCPECSSQLEAEIARVVAREWNLEDLTEISFVSYFWSSERNSDFNILLQTTFHVFLTLLHWWLLRKTYHSNHIIYISKCSPRPFIWTKHQNSPLEAEIQQFLSGCRGGYHGNQVRIFYFWYSFYHEHCFTLVCCSHTKTPIFTRVTGFKQVFLNFLTFLHLWLLGKGYHSNQNFF